MLCINPGDDIGIVTFNSQALLILFDPYFGFLLFALLQDEQNIRSEEFGWILFASMHSRVNHDADFLIKTNEAVPEPDTHDKGSWFTLDHEKIPVSLHTFPYQSGVG